MFFPTPRRPYHQQMSHHNQAFLQRQQPGFQHPPYQRRPYRQMPQPFQQSGFPQQAAPKKKSIWTAPFTDDEGKFDLSRTATSVDKFVKTFQQVSPYVSRISSFFTR
ncbi:YppG family protein [Shouchella clausii]|uniref:YppG family protein n=1 Tax=Shouchella clausii TaxID=79880 RepID=UPI000D84C8F5|nr:YppG family protein [Shouchella clausii]SPU22470.1 Uncharacterised protein [Niallia circulans]MBU8594969.1 YppG family protein [Shouchella clausii]MCM3549339.1 YppG family protein [Shouchella clausii]MCY1105764.1 YppG family protein [Shouchella clausii]MEB5482412.1 YppG family protein [Shouchella clausii]